MHAFAGDRPVVPLGAGQGRGEPDLLVRWLLVDHVGAVGWECDC